MAIDGIPLVFDRGYSEYDKKRQGVIFYASQGRQKFTCSISREAILDCFEEPGSVAIAGSDVEAGCLAAFEQVRVVIEARVRLYIEAGKVQTYRRDDGGTQTEVNLRRKDFC